MTTLLIWEFSVKDGGFLISKSEHTNRTYTLKQNSNGTFALYVVTQTGKTSGFGYDVDYASLGHALFAAEYFESSARTEVEHT
jgi:hypothetical protein